MKLRTVQLFTLFALALGVQACSGPTSLAGMALQGLEGTGHCPPGMYAYANGLVTRMRQLQTNVSMEQVIAYLGQPVERKQVVLSDARALEVWLYQTGHRKCRGLPTEEEYSPVVFRDALLMGAGLPYYDQAIKPYVVEERSYVSGQKLGNGFLGAFDYAVYPFNKAF